MTEEKNVLGSTGVFMNPPSDSVLMKGSLKSVYDSLELNLSGLSRQAFDFAKIGWDKLRSDGKLDNQSVLSIVDFSQASDKKRLYVLDMENYKVLYNTWVAHGKNSGKEWASDFSNKPSSYKSSPGFYITGLTYNGSNGYSLKLDGIESGINDNAFQRAIVMHGADYVNESFINSRGYIGRSQGCPAVPVKEARPIINTIKNGACLYIHAPASKYLSRSLMLKDSVTT
ncbi:MAG: murein L,D-transpeptidase catalytic domain family protein [Chitinophagaceae bacterium]